jgi:hypothetical protein
MANNIVQVKRTSVTGRTPNTTNSGNAQYIAAGEFALNMSDGILYTSNGSTLITVGSNLVNQSVTGNLTVKAVIANGSLGTAGQILASNSTGVYWTEASGGGGSSNIQVQNTSVSTPNNGVLYWNNDIGKLLIYYTDGDSNQFVEATVSGQPGPEGAAATVNVNSTTTVSPGTAANVVNIGNNTAASLNFTIPRGSTVAVNNSVVTGTPGSAPSISVTSNSTFDNVITFTLSTGEKGDKGDTGNTGPIAAVTASILFQVSNENSPLTTGVKGDLVIPFDATINEWSLLADQTGNVVVDIWKDTYANYPPTVGDSITASAKPTISSNNKAQSSTLTGWTTTISAGDILRFNIDSVDTIERLSINLKVSRT